MKDEYHSDYDRVSKSMLNVFCESRELYRHYYVDRDLSPPRPSSAMDIGTIVHAVLLDRKHIDEVVAVYPESCYRSDGGLNGHAAKAFRADNPGRIAIKADDAAVVASCVQAVVDSESFFWIDHPDARREEISKWNQILPCRAMVDLWVDDGASIYAFDIKTTAKIELSAFIPTARRLRYWLQDAHYSTGLQTLHRRQVVFEFICVETQPPFRVARRRYDDAARNLAFERYVEILDDVAECYETNTWSDTAEGGVDFMSLKPWEVGRTADELVEWNE